MTNSELSDFLPYLLNQAAEQVSREFQRIYKERYGMLRMEWRVLFHLGRHGEMTATQICTQAAIHKTKVSRAVSALHAKRMIDRRTVEDDRRSERLTLTKTGLAAFADLSREAKRYDLALGQALGAGDLADLKALLKRVLDQQGARGGA